MIEKREPGSLTSADRSPPAGALPPVVTEIVRRGSETLRQGAWVALLGLATFILGILVALAWVRAALPLYVLGD